jgi:uncharacterized membrane protein
MEGEMFRFSSQQTVQRPAGEIWRYATEVERHPEWMALLDARRLDADMTTVGSRGVHRMTFAGRPIEVEMAVATVERDRRIGWRALRGGPFRAEVTIELEPVDATTTRVTWGGWMAFTGLMRLLEPLLAGEVRRNEAAELVKLKANLEGRPAPETVPLATA